MLCQIFYFFFQVFSSFFLSLSLSSKRLLILLPLNEQQEQRSHFCIRLPFSAMATDPIPLFSSYPKHNKLCNMVPFPIRTFLSHTRVVCVFVPSVGKQMMIQYRPVIYISLSLSLHIYLYMHGNHLWLCVQAIG